MFFSKVLTVFVGVAAIAASPLSTRQGAGEVCHYTMTPASDPGQTSEELVAAMTYALGRQLSVEAPSHIITNGDKCTITPNGNGTYSVTSRFQVLGMTDAEVGTLIETWVGKAIPAFRRGSVLDWTVNAVDCD